MKILPVNFGCKLNMAELQEILCIAQKYGHTPTNSIQKSDLVIINACHVTQKAHQKLLKYLNKISPFNKQIIITGCLPTDFFNQKHISNISVYSDKNKISKIFSQTNNIYYKNNYSSLKTRAFIKIQSGCNTRCSYCLIPSLRGPSVSVKPSKIIQQIKSMIKNGYQEIVLTGTNLGKYHCDKINLSNLIELIVKNNNIPRLRISSIDVTDITTDLIKIYQQYSDIICPHFHLALQSGSDRILKLMKRPYNTTYFYNTVKTIYHQIQNATITTDIIVGFPNEKTVDFLQTCYMIKKCNFLKTHIFTYSEHPSTASAQIFPKINHSIAKKRLIRLKTIANKSRLDNFDKYLGQKFPVLLENIQHGIVKGYTPNYLPITIKTLKHNKLHNQIFNCKLIKIESENIIGKILA